jgi:uncharacterized protein YjiS (DUF1127 family)
MLVTLSTIVRFAITKEPGGFSRRLNACCDEIAAYFFRGCAITSLGELDDRALHDIGLERSQIGDAVYRFVTLRNRGRM